MWALNEPPNKLAIASLGGWVINSNIYHPPFKSPIGFALGQPFWALKPAPTSKARGGAVGLIIISPNNGFSALSNGGFTPIPN